MRGHGFDPDSTVDIYVNVVGSESFPDPSDTRTVDDLGVFEGKVDLLLPGSSLAYVLTAVTRGQDGPQATAQVDAPCPPTVEVTPTCVSPDSPFDMSFVADGFSPGGSIQVGLYLPTGVTPIVSDPLTADDRGHVEYTFSDVGPVPAGTYQAAAVEGSSRAMIARSSSRGLVAQTPIELPCPTPRIALDPNCAPSGSPQDRYDITVAGTGWAYGPAVLTWDVGGSDEKFQIGRSATTASSACVSRSPAAWPGQSHQGARHPDVPTGAGIQRRTTRCWARTPREHPATRGTCDLPGPLQRRHRPPDDQTFDPDCDYARARR